MLLEMFYSEREKQIQSEQNKTVSSLHKSRQFLLNVLKETNNEHIINKINKTIRIMENYIPDFQKYLNNQISDTKKIVGFDMFNKIKTFFRRANKKDIANVDCKQIEETISKIIQDVRIAQKLDKDLKGIEEHITEYIDKNGGESTVIGKEQLETTLTLDYQSHKRGKKRIILDGIQNHLPADSKGNNVYIQFFDEQEKKWIPLEKTKRTSNTMTKIRFVDDGIGYDLKNLLFFFSTKGNEKESAGQFGEGIKMIAAAALREGVDIEFESQNWKAKPISKTITYNNTNEEKSYSMQQLCYNVEYLQRTEKFVGSRTIFHNPSHDFIKMVQNIGDYVLAFRDSYTPIDKAFEGDIVSLKDSELYLKGIYINSADNTYFSYNFYDIELNRDRDKLESSEYRDKIQEIIRKTSSKEVILTLLKKEKDARGRSYKYETSSYFNPKNPELWRKSFYEAYGDNAIIMSEEDYENNKIYNKINELDYIPVKFANKSFYKTLVNAGINSAVDIYNKYANYEIETSFTLDYMKNQRGIERIVLDGIQNHLPSDSGGTYVDILIINKQGKILDLNKAIDLECRDIKKIIFKDNGKGYDVNYLGILKSDKEENRKAAGQFGEGLKMLATTCLRNNIDVVFRSRSWEAKADTRRIKVDGKSVEKLIFTIKDNADKIFGSETEFSNIDKSLWNEVKNIYDKVLFFRKGYKCLHEDETGSQALHYEDGAIFVKDIFLTDKYKNKIIFSYNIKTDLINRDRNHIDQDLIKDHIKNIITTSYNKDMIKILLEKAVNHRKKSEDIDAEGNYFEFKIMEVKFPKLRKESFYEAYGDNAILDDSTTFEEEADARALGYNPISMDGNIRQTLQKIGIPGVREKIKENEENYNWISYEDLTDKQKKVFAIYKILDKYLEGNYKVPIKFFKDNSMEKKGKKILGFYHTSKRYIAFRQEILDDTLSFSDTYIHEKAHQITGASDETREHFTYVCKSYAKLIHLIEEEKINNIMLGKTDLNT